MIGALLAKRFARRGFAALNRQDLPAILAAFDEQAVFEFPGRTELSGRFEGRSAIEQHFRTWFARRDRIRFHVTHVCVESPFAIGLDNTVTVEWDDEETDLDGVTHRLEGITVLEARGGRIVRARDYVYDHEALARTWPRPRLAVVEPGSGA